MSKGQTDTCDRCGAEAETAYCSECGEDLCDDCFPNMGMCERCTKDMWVRIDDKHKLRNPIDLDEFTRVYGWEGSMWPRLCLNVYREDDPNLGSCVKITTSRKEKPGHWWSSERGVPMELLDDVREMLQSVEEE